MRTMKVKEALQQYISKCDTDNITGKKEASPW